MDFIKKNILKLSIGVLGLVALIIIIVSLLIGGNKNSADERGLISAAKSFYNSRSELLPKNDYESSTVAANTLINENYLEQPKNNDGTVKICFSYVTVIKMKEEYVYNPYVKCNNELDTKLLYDTIINNVVTTGDGIYKINDEFIFKGENPNNFVQFADKLWRIVKVDENKSIKIIYSDNDKEYDVWDDRFNTDTNETSGINDYSVSRINSYLKLYLNDSKNFTDIDKSKLAFTDLCIGKRRIIEDSIDGLVECSKKQEKQIISLLQANEYLSASNDPKCSANTQKACQNYNFLAKNNYWTITGVMDNTTSVYQVYPDDGLKVIKAEEDSIILPVVSFRNDTVILRGTGTENDPYILR